jgi:hypothetical protein
MGTVHRKMYISTKMLAVLKSHFCEFNKDTDAVCLHWQATVSFSDCAWLTSQILTGIQIFINNKMPLNIIQ